MPAYNSLRATTAIRSNNQVPSGPLAVNGVFKQILSSPCKRSLFAYNLLSAGWMNTRVEKYNRKNGIIYNC